jgi:hypothetical protein
MSLATRHQQQHLMTSSLKRDAMMSDLSRASAGLAMHSSLHMECKALSAVNTLMALLLVLMLLLQEVIACSLHLGHRRHSSSSSSSSERGTQTALVCQGVTLMVVLMHTHLASSSSSMAVLQDSLAVRHKELMLAEGLQHNHHGGQSHHVMYRSRQLTHKYHHRGSSSRSGSSSSGLL